ncbi:hypothetical protein [Polynucleobacter sp. AP-Latsch-80-C2]|jgi:hypothetical protein|uniref:hypothetical protein n=1 Tax=Polynucleobacter sp. AP-Latsch-80-C2 TaxID=2576931 RepID=UPI001C0DF9FD|nr:hypothetical protein [Polynucleobacter sp. AP-Latsch-80-C2]MBU3624490.1 hypothetical protein [Polynucleobacter sp. AP-Latsch-80-C2]
MNFIEIATEFKNGSSGTDVFKKFSKDVFSLLETEGENGGMYFVVATAAKNYYLNFEDQAVGEEFTIESKNIITDFNDRIIFALTSSPEIKLKVTSELASNYHWHTDKF